MSEVKKLTERHLDGLIRILANAYPGFKVVTEEDHKRLEERLWKRMKEDPTTAFYGSLRKKELQGVLRLHDFLMTFASTKIPVGGVGLVGVDLLHKKEKVAKEMMLFYLRHYRRRGYPLAALHPFRPDFYKRMGFGYGTKMNQYRIRPGDLPRGKTKAHVHFLGKDDQKAAQACFQRVAGKTHGMFERTDFEGRMMFESPSLRLVGCVRDGRILGYVAFTFKPGKNVLVNPMEIAEWVYETPEALAELLTFLHTQADQVHEIIFNSQDEDFHFLPLDPRNGTENLMTSGSHETNVAGVGIMYRVLHIPRTFQALGEHDFGGQSCKLKITLKDSFLRENEGSTIVHFWDGKPTVKPRGEHEAEIRMDVAEFSSLLMRVIPFKSLLAYGLAGISKEKYAEVINRLFLTEAKPICLTDF